MAARTRLTRELIVLKLSQGSPALPEVEIRKIVSNVFDALAYHLESGSPIEIRGLGTFEVLQSNRKVFRNPVTGQEVKREKPRHRVKFRLSSVIQDTLDKHPPEDI